jgi:membrane protease YdiL (CAAX protease family)
MTDPKLTWPRAVVLHLAPGAAALLVFAATAPWLAGAGLPAVWGMFAAVLLAVVPVELAVMRQWAVAHTGRATIRSIVDLGWPRGRRLAVMLPATLAAAALAPGLVQWSEPFLHRWMAPVLPDWWQLSPGPAGGRPAWEVSVTLTGWLLCFVVLGPAVEELYFRGFLLPRLPTRPAFAVATNASLFALYHLWQPSAWPTVAVFALPLAVVALRSRGVVVAAAVHGLVNLAGMAAILGGGLTR